MNQQDYSKFAEAFANAHEVMPGGKVLSQGAMMACIDALVQYPIEVLLLAIKKHIQTAKFAPTPKDIIDMLSIGRVHICADEAWGLVLKSFDETLTVIVTPEIMQARGLIIDIYNAGDLIGARMGFREAYNRIISTTNHAPEWLISAGSDGVSRVSEIEKAAQIGRLPKTAGVEYRLGQDKPTTTVSGLLESANEQAQKTSDEEFKKLALRNLSALKSMLEFNQDDGIARREKERKEFELHKQAELAKVEQKLGGLH